MTPFKMPRPPVTTLCETCANGTVTSDPTGIRSIDCWAGAEGRTVGYRVVDCTSYYERNKTTRSDYEKTAWIIVPATDKKGIGFIRPGTPEHKKATGRD